LARKDLMAFPTGLKGPDQANGAPCRRHHPVNGRAACGRARAIDRKRPAALQGEPAIAKHARNPAKAESPPGNACSQRHDENRGPGHAAVA